MRLQKFLARAGVASRRGSEDLMTAGRVQVNGEVVCELGSKVDPNIDIVSVDGKQVNLQDEAAYIILNKPAGVLSTMRDPQGRPCVASLVPHNEYPGLFPVGRLDKDTTGLLLFSTDGSMGQGLLHPKHHVSKTYRVLAQGHIEDEELDVLRCGIMLDDGMTKPANVVLDSAGTNSKVSITISEGRKRQVKRMFGAISHPVLKLHRDIFAGICLGDLPQGQWRHLDKKEVEHLRGLVSERTGDD